MNKEILQETIREWHSKTPDDVHGVGRSYKVKNGVRTNELCVVFLVLHKKPLAELRSEEILPTSLVIDNETISTDVIEIPRFQALTNCRNPPSTTNRARHRPLIGGISMSHNEDAIGIYREATAGTLGGLFKDKEDGSVVGLTNCHVVCPRVATGATWSSHKNPEWAQTFTPWDIESKQTQQPGRADGGVVSTGNIGNIKRYYPLTTHSQLDQNGYVFPNSGEVNYCDAAIVGLDSKDLIGPRSGSQLGPPPYDGYTIYPNRIMSPMIYRSRNTTPIKIFIQDWQWGPSLHKVPAPESDFDTGQTVIISGHTGNPAANGTWTITRLYGDIGQGTDASVGGSYCFSLNGSTRNPLMPNGVTAGATGTINRQSWGGDVAAYPVATTAEIDSLHYSPHSALHNFLIISGRTTGYSGNSEWGCKIYATIDNAIFSVEYDDGIIVFVDQIIISYEYPGLGSPIEPGDSGSIVLADFNGVLKMVGLISAGGDYNGGMSRIDHVMSLLNLEVLGSTTSINPPSNWSFINLPASRHVPGSNTVSATITHNGLKYWECGKLSNGNTKYVTYTHKLSPSPPQNVVAVRGNGQVTLSWDVPYSNGGSLITDYIVKYSINGGVAGSWKNFSDPVSTATSLTVTGLTNGTRYVFKVIAKNAVGIGPPSANSQPVTPATVPGSPTGVAAVRGNASLTVAWAAPASTGGSPITDYAVEYSSNGGSTFTSFAHPASTATSLAITGLTNGTAYVIRVYARNAIGYGAVPSDNSAPVTPATVPGSPTGVAAVRGNSSLAVTWAPPANTGGSPITDYLVKYSSNGGLAFTSFAHPASTATSLAITGLTNGTAYVIKVVAKNAVGISLPSANSAPVTPATVPGSPTLVVAKTGIANSLAVTWTAPANTGGSAITDYLVKYSSNGGLAFTSFAHPASTATSLAITGLTNGTPYVFKVIAKNAVGIGPPSANSTPTTPLATVPSSPTLVVATSGNASLAVTWTAPANTGGSAITEYIIKYSSNSGSTWQRSMPPSSAPPITATSYTITGLTNGIPYVIKVIACNAVGISLPSANSAPATPAA